MLRERRVMGRAGDGDAVVDSLRSRDRDLDRDRPGEFGFEDVVDVMLERRVDRECVDESFTDCDEVEERRDADLERTDRDELERESSRLKRSRPRSLVGDVSSFCCAAFHFLSAVANLIGSLHSASVRPKSDGRSLIFLFFSFLDLVECILPARSKRPFPLTDDGAASFLLNGGDAIEAFLAVRQSTSLKSSSSSSSIEY